MLKAVGSMRTIGRSTVAGMGIAALLFASGACGSDDTAPLGSGKCAPVGATQPCTGPGACAGGQVCGSDGTWGTCDCGGGTGGAGGDAGLGGSSGSTGGSPSGGASGTGGSGNAAGAGGGAAGGGATGGGGASGKCPTGPGPAMVNVGPFCIDTTEVTQAQYTDFLNAKGGDVSGQLAKECDWNTSFEPVGYPIGSLEVDITSCFENTYDPVAKANYPISCIDWCDAHTYCAWAGKRLCGAMGGGGTIVSPASPREPGTAEWVYACSNAGTSAWTFGTTPSDSVCHTHAQAALPKPVKSMPDCHGVGSPFDQVFDLVGNVAELADDCTPWNLNWNTPDKATCKTHGGDYRKYATDSECTDFNFDGMNRSDRRRWLGFRCCADVIEP